ncbi:type 4 pilus major pilin [Alcanivorax sp. 1008]|uniref:type 4 pilus major pilin n=1 Tax=Alcanivorax sp. 1008 TaxID=2816853 RepID=UPI001DE98AF4|nr:type 4 pilus major pilin [Alcanivorax sp. 1008]MCC1496723.1 prepilin-type N-terminal cleavage/methylation domain-containing protein [Alcanivorax sp. 1008]
MMKSKMNKGQAGFTLIEILLVMAVVVVIIAGAFAVYTQLTSSGTAQAESTALAATQAKIREVYGTNARRYTGLGEADVAAGRMAPASMLSDTDADGVPDALVSGFGALITIAPVNVNGANDGFSITYTDVPSQECVDLVPRLATQFKYIQVAAGGGLAAFAAATAVGGGGVARNAFSGGDLDRGYMIAQCNSAATVDLLLATN